jgi:peptide/nickel transport system substrate-binding protein
MARNQPRPHVSHNPMATFAPTRRQVLIAGGMTLGASLLAACSSSSPSGSPAPQGSPKKGGTVRLAVSDGDASESLDPGLTLSTNAQTYGNAIYDQLVAANADTQPVPALAESWEVTPDAKEWTFHLRKGVTWHDGSDFTSADVVATVGRWIDPESGHQLGAMMIPLLDASGVSAPDDYTVVLKLKTPYSTLPAALGGNFASMVTKKGTTEFSLETAVGTGPFKLTAWTPGVSWAATRNDSYWGGAPYLDGITATVTPDQGAKLQGALAGSFEVTDTIPISLWSTLEGKSDVLLEPIDAKNVWVFTFDQRSAPFDDPRVVEAIKLATDRDSLVKIAMQGHGQVVADVPLVTTSEYYPTGLTPDYDVEQAKSLLAEAGFPGGLDIELSTTGDLPGMLDVAQAWQQGVKAAGIRVELKQFPLSTYWSEGWMATPAFMDYWNRYSAPSYFDVFYTKSAIFPETGYEDPELESLVAQIHAETDADKQTALVQQAFQLTRERFGYLIPAYTDAAFARSKGLQGVVWSYANSLDFRKAWLA